MLIYALSNTTFKMKKLHQNKTKSWQHFVLVSENQFDEHFADRLFNNLNHPGPVILSLLL
jgi:hypothetical protein